MQNEDKKNNTEEVLVLNNKDDKDKIQLANESDQTYHSVKINENTTNFELYKGFFFMLLSCIFRTSSAISAKLILLNNEQLTAFQLNAITSYYMIVISCFIVFLCLIGCIEIELPKSKKPIILILIRGFLAVIVETMLVSALKYLPSSNVYSVFFMYPGIVLLLSICFLNESSTFMDFLCLPTCVVGVCLVVRPNFLFHYEIDSKSAHNENVMNEFNFHIYLLILVACISKGTADFLIRKVKSGVHFIIVPMVMSLLGLLIFPILPMVDHLPFPELTLKNHYSFMINAILFFSYQAFLAYAMQFENAGRVVMVNYLQLVFLFFADLYIFLKPYHTSDLIGILMITFINLGNAMYKTMSRLNEKEKLMEKVK